MIHLLLLYRVLFYTFGFSILGFTTYKYIKTKNKVIGSFLFLWAAMTATAASYVINYYIYINFTFNVYSLGNKVQGISILITSLALPIFVHTVFKIKSKIIIKIIFIIVLLISIAIFLPFGISWNFVMFTIVGSNLYSFISAFISILKIKSISNKKVGLFFMSSFILFFGLLLIIDIMPSELSKNGFVFFPTFYMWIGGFCVYIGITRLNLTENITDNSLEKFIVKYKLTKRESEIALLLADGSTYKKIAEELFISPGTVSTHVMHIYEKTGTSSKIQLNKQISKIK